MEIMIMLFIIASNALLKTKVEERYSVRDMLRILIRKICGGIVTYNYVQSTKK
jgi:hypothetical protein